MFCTMIIFEAENEITIFVSVIKMDIKYSPDLYKHIKHLHTKQFPQISSMYNYQHIFNVSSY